MFSKITITKIAVQQIYETNRWAKADHLEKSFPVTYLKINSFTCIFQGFYFENPQQIFCRAVI